MKMAVCTVGICNIPVNVNVNLEYIIHVQNYVMLNFFTYATEMLTLSEVINTCVYMYYIVCARRAIKNVETHQQPPLNITI